MDEETGGNFLTARGKVTVHVFIYERRRDCLRFVRVAFVRARGRITAESEIYDRPARRSYKRRPVIVFISMPTEHRGADSWEEQEGQVFPISRRVLLRRNATRDPEHARVARGWRHVVLRGTGKDAGQQNWDEKEKGGARGGRRGIGGGESWWMKERKRGKYNGDGVEVERKDRLYNPRNTGCDTAAYTYKRRKRRANGWPLITA